MVAKVYIPRVSGVRLVGMRPVFMRDIQRDVSPGMNIILGGNGLGKTTTMQAIVFALTGGTGGADDLADLSAPKGTLRVKVELSKSYRWNHTWFDGRVAHDDQASAQVEVDFSLGDRKITVRRRFDGTRLQAVRLDGAWIDSRIEAERALDDELHRAGYRSAGDFAFIVTRLLYLREDRRTLAWDPDAQARILMILSPDAIDEGNFRVSRITLKRTDSKRRHQHVKVEKLRTEVEKLAEPARSAPAIEPSTAKPSSADTAVALKNELRRITAELSTMPSRQEPLFRDLARLDETLGEHSASIEKLRSQIDDTEAAIIRSSLTEIETQAQLPLADNLLQRGICPACGTFHAELRDAAQKRAESGACVLCGSSNGTPASDENITALQSQLQEKLKAQREADDRRRFTKARFNRLREEQDELLFKSANIRRQLDLLLPEAENQDALVRPKTPREIRGELLTQENEEAQILADVQSQKSRVERTYRSFMRAAVERTERLQELYARYATTFLGLECTLEKQRTRDRLFKPQQFVPRFNSVIRESPDDCSEAQVFFLDIALRMAFLDLAATMSGAPGSFICETPEKALDLSYIDNVGDMFTKFGKQGHSVILTANIQKEGLAKHLIAKWNQSKYAKRVLQLMEHSQLSSVQERRRSDLTRFSQRKP